MAETARKALLSSIGSLFSQQIMMATSCRQVLSVTLSFTSFGKTGNAFRKRSSILIFYSESPLHPEYFQIAKYQEAHSPPPNLDLENTDSEASTCELVFSPLEEMLTLKLSCFSKLCFIPKDHLSLLVS